MKLKKIKRVGGPNAYLYIYAKHELFSCFRSSACRLALLGSDDRIGAWPEVPATDRETDMDIRLVDRDTLAIAKLVAESEGISLEQAIREELELWGSVTA